MTMVPLLAMLGATAAAAQTTPPDGDITVTGTRATTATKTDTPIVETPQSISVVSDTQIRDRGALNLQETLRYSAGLQGEAFGLDTRQDTIQVRGLAPVQFLDGMRNIYTFTPIARTAIEGLKRVEVLRGPSSVLYGQASNGGIVNSISKRPAFVTDGSVRLDYGRYDRKQATLDLTGPLDSGGTLAGRITVAVRDAGQQTREIGDDRVFIQPALAWRPGPDTSLTAIGRYQRDTSASSQQFLPLAATILAASAARRIDNRSFLGDRNYDTLRQRSASLTLLGEHRFSDLATVDASARYTDAKVTFREIFPDVYSDPLNPFIDGDASTGRRVNRNAYQVQGDVKIFITDSNLKLAFDTGPLIHRLLVGIDYSDFRQRTRSGFGATTPIDIYAPVSTGVVAPAYADDLDQRNSQLGVYMQDQIRYGDRVTLVVGGRRDRARSKTEGAPAQIDKASTYKAGLIGNLGSGVSPYVSYSDAFLPLAGLDIAGKAFVPTRGRQYEGGVKWQPRASLLVTAAYFDIVESNRPTNDPNNVLNTVQTGKIASRGFEIEGAFSAARDLELTAAYSFTDAVVTESNFAAEVGQRVADTPRHLASVWGVKTLALDDAATLRLGAGVRYVGATQSIGAALTLRTPGYTLADALVAIDWQRWTLSVNATNLFDRDYYAPCRAFGDCFTGNGRNVIGSLAYRFGS